MHIVSKEELGETNTDTSFIMLPNNNNTTTNTQNLRKRKIQQQQQQQQQRPDDFSDWPDNDRNGNFKRIPIKKRTTPLQGFYAGLENTDSRENGIFKANVVSPYPPVPQMGITRIGDRHALYTTGQLESGLGIVSPVIRGDTDDMRVHNLRGNDFDNIQQEDRTTYGTYVPLTDEEERDLLANVKGGKRRRKTTRKHKTCTRKHKTRSAKKSKKNGRRRKTNIKRSYRKYKYK